jgi:hypothetical protein
LWVTTSPNSSSKINIWNNKTEYLNLLNQLFLQLENDELKKEIQLRIEGYPLAEALINDFNREHPDFSFGDLLSCLYEKMNKTAILGASYMTNEQNEGFTAYYRLRNSLPENIIKIIFPFYAYDPGDPNCISSASRVLKSQIDRLNRLNFHTNSLIPSEQALKIDVTPYINWLEKKLSPLIAPTISEATELHWTGRERISLKAYQYFTFEPINITLQYVELKDGEDVLDAFALALIEKFKRDEASFSNASPEITVILRNMLNVDEKKEAIKNMLRELNSKPLDLNTLKIFCKADRDLFRSIRGEFFRNAYQIQIGLVQDEQVWEELEKKPDLIRNYLNVMRESLDKDLPSAITVMIQSFLNIEIPLSKCHQGKIQVIFKGTGAAPHVMFDERDDQFKLLVGVH